MGDLSKNFSRSEFACKCGNCSFDTVDAKLIEVVQAARDRFGPLRVNSGCRCEAHNKTVGGSPNSQHRLGRAADIATGAAPTSVIAGWIIENYPWVSVGVYPSFVHVDTRTQGGARW